MTCPRCGSIINGFPCSECGFPETKNPVNLKYRMFVRKLKRQVQESFHEKS